MTSATETEIKLQATAAMIARLRDHPRLAGSETRASLVTTYFDSTDRRLERAGMGLRIRAIDQHREQTLKTAAPDGGMTRGEWTAAVDADRPILAAFPTARQTAIRKALAGVPLEPFAVSRVDRRLRRVRAGGSTIEVAFDEGALEAGERRQPVCEIEFELIDGNLYDIVTLILDLPIGADLNWAVASKMQRCAELAAGEAPKAARAGDPGLSPDMNVAAGFRAIAWNCLGQLVANSRLVVGRGDDDAIHQARVAIRRLRAACKLFGPAVADDREPVLLGGAKAVAHELGKSRDFHVLHRRLAEAAADRDGEFGALLGHVARLHADGTAAAQAVMTGEPFQRLLFELACWIENGAWQSGAAQNGAKDAVREPLVPFARNLLSKLRRKLHPKRTPLADLGDPALHRLRIRAKRLRYAVEFFEALWGEAGPIDQREAFSRSLRRLQDDLGDLHDIAVADERRASLFGDEQGIASAEMAAQFALLLKTVGKRRKKLLKSAQKELDRIIDGPRWSKTA